MYPKKAQTELLIVVVDDVRVSYSQPASGAGLYLYYRRTASKDVS